MNKYSLDDVLTLISDTIKVKKEKLNINTNPENTPQWDSINHIAIILKITKKFKKKINTSKISSLNSVKKILQYLSE